MYFLVLFTRNERKNSVFFILKNGDFDVMKQVLESAGALRLDIHSGSYVNLDERWHNTRRCSPYTRLYFVESGEGFVRVAGKKIMLEPGYVYMIPSGVEFDYGCPRKLTKLYFHITLTALEGLDLLAQAGQVCRASWSRAEFEQLLTSVRAKDYVGAMQLNMLLYRAVVECLRSQPELSMPVAQYSSAVEMAMQYIRANVRMGLTAQEVAHALFLSESGLRKRFREETGMTLGQYMDDLLFVRARQLLAQERGSIGEISRELGFSDQYYFSRRFKEKFKQTPTRFRRELLEKQA